MSSKMRMSGKKAARRLEKRIRAYDEMIKEAKITGKDMRGYNRPGSPRQG